MPWSNKHKTLQTWKNTKHSKTKYQNFPRNTDSMLTYMLVAYLSLAQEVGNLGGELFDG